MGTFSRLLDTVTARSRTIIVLFLVVSLLLAFGVPMIEGESSMDQFETDQIESDKLDFVDEHFSGSENTTITQIIVRDDNVLTKDTLIDQLEFQQDLRDDTTVNETIVDEEGLVGIANLVAEFGIHQEAGAALEANHTELTAVSDALHDELTWLNQHPDASIQASFEVVEEDASFEFTEEQYETFETAAQMLRSADTDAQIEEAYQLGTAGVLEPQYEALAEEQEALEDGLDPTIDDQIDYLESINQTEIDEIIELGVSDDNSQSDEWMLFLPTDFERDSIETNATLMIATLEGETGAIHPGDAPDSIVDAELAMQDIAGTQTGDVSYQIFGDGITSDEMDSSMMESLLIVAPFALLFVLIVLALAYRDILDILLGIVGIVLVLLWTLGIMGWFGVNFNQIFIAVPVLLIGLSIDYAIHVLMRHREHRNDGGEQQGIRTAMRMALAGVGVALVVVTATTMIGFLSNVVSPLNAIREFGIVSAVGILSAFLIFGALMPVIKVELDEWLEDRGYDRQKRAFGTEGGRLTRVLSIGGVAAKKAPYVVLIIALLISAGGVYGATNIDSSFETEDFVAEQPPDWTDELPDVLAPSDYTAAESISYLNERFVRQDNTADILVEGDITQDDTLQRVAAAEDTAAEQDVTATLSSGDSAISSPLSAMEEVAADNESFNETFTAADTTGDGIPDEELANVYDHFYETDPDRAESVLYRTDAGEYEALLMVVSVDGAAEGDDITDEMRAVAADLDGDGLSSTATGQVIINSLTEDELLDTVVQSLLVSFFAVLVFLMATYRRTANSASLGAITLLPVALTVTWILGTMYLLDIPFNIVTGMITSITIGLGVAYSIHVTERFTLELNRTDSVWRAMETTISGTGGALLGSAATTAGGFSVLIVAFLPFLQEFGMITALMIVYAFFASVLVLPSLLALWARFVHPDKFSVETETTDTAVTGDMVQMAGDTAIDYSSDLDVETGGLVEFGDSQAIRNIKPVYVSPGQTFTVTVVVQTQEDWFILRESFSDERTAITSLSPDPVESFDSSHGVHAVFNNDDGDKQLIEYELTLPAELADGSHSLVDGSVVTPAENVEIEGSDTIDVVSNLFERIVARDEVTGDDLQLADEQLQSGELTERQFKLITQAWLRELKSS